TGILVLVPVMATIDLLLWFIRTIDASARSFIPVSLIPFDFHGLGIVLALAIILVTGALMQNFIGSWLINTFDLAIKRTPVLGGIYGGIKKFMETIFHQRSDRFSGVVLVEFPRTGIYSIGFRT